MGVGSVGSVEVLHEVDPRAQSRKGARAWTLRGSADLAIGGPRVSAWVVRSPSQPVSSATRAGRQPQRVGCVPAKTHLQKQVGAGSGPWAAVC